MKNFVQPGSVIDVPSAAAPVAAGQVVIIGTLIAIAVTHAAIGEAFSANLDGVFELPKVSGSAWTQGMLLMWDASAKAFAPVAATAAGDVTGAGVAAFAAAASADTKALVRLSGIPGTVAA